MPAEVLAECEVLGVDALGQGWAEAISGGLTDARREVDGRGRVSDAAGRLHGRLGPRAHTRRAGGSVAPADALRVVRPVRPHAPAPADAPRRRRGTAGEGDTGVGGKGSGKALGPDVAPRGIPRVGRGAWDAWGGVDVSGEESGARRRSPILGSSRV